MKTKLDFLTPACNALLAFLIAFSGAACLCTAFSLDVQAGRILLSCLFWAAAISVLLRISRGWLMTLGLLLLAAVVNIWRGGLLNLAALADTLFSFYENAYGWSLPDLTDSYNRAFDLTGAMATVGGVCALTLAMCLQARSTPGALAIAALPLLPCLVVTDTVPDTGWLFVLLVLMALLLLTGHVRRRDSLQATQLTALLLIPTLLASWLLFAWNPKDTYDKASDEEDFGQRVLEFLDKIPLVETDKYGHIWLDLDIPMPTVIIDPTLDITLPPLSLPSFTVGPEILDLIRDQVSLGNAGPRQPGQTKVFSVTSDYRGVLYLRERGYDLYTGTAWGSGEGPQYLEMSPQYIGLASQVEIASQRARPYLLVPYYTYLFREALPEGYKAANGTEMIYSFQAYALRQDWQSLWQTQEGTPIGQIRDYTQYLQLTDYAREEARKLLEQLGIHEQTDVVTAAQRIEAYVRTSARYDLNTQTMPKDAKDFAIWFLTESETGYCVHFASAAAVLLRAAGIPARYVEGYIAPMTAHQVDVTSDLAHAWVEYYVPGMGWVVMEATPSLSELPPEPTTKPTEPTTRPTEPTTKPTEPTTQPTEPTTQPTEPTTKPTEPTTQPTEPTTQPTEPTTQPTQPTATPGGTTAAPTESSTNAEPSVPDTTVPVEPPTPRPQLWATLSGIFFLLAAACALFGQWQLRLWLKQWLRSRGDANRQARQLWRECQMLAKLRRQKAPTVLRDLAWKAAYSQYTLSEEELQVFYGYMERSLNHLRKRPWYLRVIYRVIFAVY